MFTTPLLSLGHSTLTLGHEAVGVVHEAGSEVKELQPGDRVAGGAITPDGGSRLAGRALRTIWRAARRMEVPQRQGWGFRRNIPM